VSAPPTVVVTVHEEEIGGATKAVLRVLPLMRERGWRFVFWAPRPSALADALAAEGHAVHGATRTLRFGWRSLRHGRGIRANLTAVPSYLRSFRSFVRAQRPALVHANSLLTLPEAAVARASGAPVLVHAHEPMPPFPKGPPARMMLGLTAHAVIAPSRATADSVAGWRVRPEVVYNGLPPSRGSRAPRAADGRLVVGTVAAVAPRKGIDVLVEAVALVRERRPDVEFRLFGDFLDDADADWARDVLARAREAGVEWTSNGDVWSELPRWDVFALPSRRDPFPLAVLEAMACGLPVVASDVGGIPEQLGADAGRLVPPGDAQALADALVELAGNADLRARLGEAGRRRVEREFTIERQAEGLHAAYLRTLERAGK
jgi:glycosyltransferase involved in cell wall biosynthesis